MSLPLLSKQKVAFLYCQGINDTKGLILINKYFDYPKKRNDRFRMNKYKDFTGVHKKLNNFVKRHTEFEYYLNKNIFKYYTKQIDY